MQAPRSTTPHRASMPVPSFLRRHVDFVLDVLPPPGSQPSQGTSRSPGVVPFNVVDTPLLGLPCGMVPHSRLPSSGGSSCMCLPFRGGVSTTCSPPGGGASCTHRGLQCLEFRSGGFFSPAC